MAVRTPLYLDGTNLKEMSSSMITNIKNRCIYLYGANPSVDVTVVSSGGNISPTMTDTRLQAGAATYGVNNGYGPGTFQSNDDYNFGIPGTSTVSVTYDRITQNLESVSQAGDTNNKRNFVYQSGGNIYAMSHTDMYDTFYNDVINTLIDGNDRPGTYRISTASSVSNMTRVSSTPVFRDTRANTGAYTSGGIAETLDQPFTVNNYYLYRVNQSIMSNPSLNHAVYIRSDNNIQQHSDSTINTILQSDIRYWARQKIRYSVNGSGSNRGDPMVDTKLNGSTRGNQQIGDTYHPNTRYRSQTFPAGTSVAQNTYSLRIRRI